MKHFLLCIGLILTVGTFLMTTKEHILFLDIADGFNNTKVDIILNEEPVFSEIVWSNPLLGLARSLEFSNKNSNINISIKIEAQNNRPALHAEAQVDLLKTPNVRVHLQHSEENESATINFDLSDQPFGYD